MGTPERGTRLGFLPILVATLFTLLLGFAHKSQCLIGEFNERAFGGLSCYSDLVPLYRSEQLIDGRFPYLDAPNEYPVGTGLLMWSTSLLGHGEGTYLVTNAVVLSAIAVVVAWLLHRLAGPRALFFSLAPTLALGAFLNWDLLAVALATAGTAALLSGRDRAAGAALGLGAAAKVYPAFLALPFGLQRLREGGPRPVARMIGWGAAAWLVVNAPIAILAPDRWSFAYRFASERGPTYGTLWYVGCRALTGDGDCIGPSLLNALSLGALVVGVALVALHQRRVGSPAPPWTLGLPVLALLLVTGKVYSPQYSLWLLPWFALVLPDLRTFVVFEATDVAVYFAEFEWIGDLRGPDPSIVPLAIAVVARAIALGIVVVAYLRRGAADLAADAPAGQRLVKTAPSSSS